MERYKTVEETLRQRLRVSPKGAPKDGCLQRACERRAREDYPEAFRVPGRMRKVGCPNLSDRSSFDRTGGLGITRAFGLPSFKAPTIQVCDINTTPHGV